VSDFPTASWQEQVDDDVRSLKQQSVKRYITPLWYIIPIPSQQVFPQSGEATNTLVWPSWGLNPQSITLEVSTITLGGGHLTNFLTIIVINAVIFDGRSGTSSTRRRLFIIKILPHLYTTLTGHLSNVNINCLPFVRKILKDLWNHIYYLPFVRKIPKYFVKFCQIIIYLWEVNFIDFTFQSI